MIMSLILLVLYFVPAIIAERRKHPNALAISWCNFLFGWTLIGWGVALVWSLTTFEQQPGARGAT